MANKSDRTALSSSRRGHIASLSRYFQRSDRLTQFILLLAALPVIAWVNLLQQYGVDVYRVDQWYTPFMAIQAAFSGDFSPQILFQQHNEARKVVPTLISVGLALANGYWDTRVENYFGLLLCVALTISMGFALRATPSLESWQRAFVVCLFSFLLWSPLTWYFHTYSVTFERLIPELCIVLGIWIFLRGATLWRQVTIFSILALISQFSFPGGLAAWPLLGILLVHHSVFSERSRWGGVAAFALIAIGAMAVYFWDYSRPPSHTEFVRLLDHSLADISNFFFMVLGRSFANEYLPGAIIGLLLTLLYSVFVAVGARRAIGEREFAAWTVLGLYSVSQALLITAGRLPMSMSSATRPDYVIHSIYIFVAMLVLLGLYFQGPQRRSGIAMLITSAFFAGALVGAVSESPLGSLRLQYHELQAGRACIQLYPLLNRQQCPHRVYPWPAQMPARIQSADELGIMQPSLVRNIDPIDNALVHGSVEVSFRVPQGLHFNGWAIVNGKTADAVVVTSDSSGNDERVIGVFRSGVRRNDVAAVMGARFRYAGWAGDIPEAELVYDSSEENCGLKAYAFYIDSSHFYPLKWNANAVASWCGRL